MHKAEIVMAAVETTRLPPINNQNEDNLCTSTQGIYTGKYIDRSPFLTPVSQLFLLPVQCLAMSIKLYSWTIMLYICCNSYIIEKIDRAAN